jgi:hypothetical protein
MASPKSREQRQIVFLQARLRGDDGWSDVTICNLSSRGLMVKCASPPHKGDFVEIHRGACCIVGHVRWSSGSRFGLRSQDDIDTYAIGQDQPGSARGAERRAAAHRRAAKPGPRRSIVAQEERSRQVGRVLEWVMIGSAIACVGGLLALQVGSVLTRPLHDARVAMEAPDR